MAGDWIKMRIDLDADPAVIGIAAELGTSETDVVGRLWKLWAWANTHTTDGNASSVTDLWIDRYVGATGFARALVSAGWLRVKPASEGGGIILPNFDRHNGKSGKTRALTRERVQRCRRNDRSVTKSLPEKRREEKRINTPPTPQRGKSAGPTVEPPEGLRTDGFRQAWSEWLAYRRERRLKAYTARTITAQFEKLAAWGQPKAIESIRASIANGWHGLFEPIPPPPRAKQTEPVDRKAEVMAQLAADRAKREQESKR